MEAPTKAQILINLFIYLFPVGEEKDCKIEKKDASNKNDLDIDKIKHAAVTALSAAAVKAKFLAEQEEDQIRKLTTSLIKKQAILIAYQLAFCLSIARRSAIVLFVVLLNGNLLWLLPLNWLYIGTEILISLLRTEKPLVKLCQLKELRAACLDDKVK